MPSFQILRQQWAESAAEAAEFAGSRGKFWEMHDLLFANQENLEGSVLNALLMKLGMTDASVPIERFSEAAKKRIQDDFDGGVRSGVNGTPTFFLNGTRYDGPTDYDSLVAVMEQVLTSDGD